MTVEPERLYTAARQVLDAIERYYQQSAIELPDRSYVSDGPAVAWDCEQVVVYVERTFPGLSDFEQAQAQDPGGLRSARLWAEVVRCSPSIEDAPTYPTPREIEDNARLVLADAVCVEQAVRLAKREGLLSSCNGLTIDDWQGLGPAGAYAGGRLGLRIQLDSV